MAEKSPNVVKLVAVERGFVDGAMVEPGQKFLFDGTPSSPKAKVEKDGLLRLPKWAALPGDERLAPRAPVAADLKPVAAQRARAAKAAELSGG